MAATKETKASDTLTLMQDVINTMKEAKTRVDPNSSEGRDRAFYHLLDANVTHFEALLRDAKGV